MSAFAFMLPRRADYAGLKKSWSSDVVAGITVGIVALPLALGFGVATGLGAAPGIITAIVAGVVAAVFGGSHVQVSGPTGAMTVVLLPLVARHGAEAVVVVGVLAGLIVIGAAMLRLGRVLAYVPWPVIEGFTLGIAVIIFLQQVPAALGVPIPEGENTALIAFAALTGSLDASTVWTLSLVGIVMVVMVVAPRLHRSLPGSLLAVITATVVAELAGWQVVPIGDLPSALPSFSIPSFGADDLGRYVPAALAVAALAGIESLLSARVADGMSDVTPHEPDRELFGQGLANIAASVLGGMPATGAIARTAVNVRAGARTRVASITHSVVLVLIVLAGATLVSRIPLAALAGVLMVTAVRMVNPQGVKAVLRATRSDAAVLAVTALSTIVFDLIVAVHIGFALAVVLTLRKIAKHAEIAEADPRIAGKKKVAAVDPVIDLSDAVAGPVVASANGEDQARAFAAPQTGSADATFVPGSEVEANDGQIVGFRLTGAVFFGVAQRLSTTLATVGDDAQVVILMLPELEVLDATGARMIGDIIADFQKRQVTVLVKGMRPDHERILGEVGALDELATDKHVFTDLPAAMTHASSHVQRNNPTKRIDGALREAVW